MRKPAKWPEMVARLIALVLLWMTLPGAALALCDVTYKSQARDTLKTIAALHYDDPEDGSRIHSANRGLLIGANGQVWPGQDLHIPCAAQPDESEMKLLTGGDNAPFTDHSWPENGMLGELVTAALDHMPAPVTYAITWDDDWSRHQFPLLDEKTHDMGFPWVRPDCAATPEDPTCANFHFSEPLMDLPIMLFKRADSDFDYATDADVVGRTLCRPAGMFTHDLDRAGRRWLSEGTVTLVQTDSAEACFGMVLAGEVDAATLDMFQGATKIIKMGLQGGVVALDQPLSRETLHVIISKKHWRGTTFLYRLNAGLEVLRLSGRYNEIMTRHLEMFWQQLK